MPVTKCVNRMNEVVCGIDPGLGTTGYAVLSGCIGSQAKAVRILDAGVCRFDESQPLEYRLVAIQDDISAIFREHKPQVVAVEQLYAHYKHPRTAILMGHARGVILQAASRAGCEVHSYAATRVKRFLTGHGRATKAQMQRTIQTTLGLPELPEPADVADALAIALCCMDDVQNRVTPEVAS